MNLNRTRYRLPAIVIVTAVAWVMSAPGWGFVPLVVGAVACVAEIGRHWRDFDHMARNLMRH